MQGIFKLNDSVDFFLASSSPRRKELLASIGITPQCILPKTPEVRPNTGECARNFAKRAAKEKALAALPLTPCSDKKQIVLAADTVVSTQDGTIFGKPKSEHEAHTMLEQLSNKKHFVTTAVHCIGKNHEELSFSFEQQSTVFFIETTPQIRAAYIASGEPMDKAGAYAVQGKGAFMVSKIEGSYTNVVGLPMAELIQILLAKNIIVPTI